MWVSSNQHLPFHAFIDNFSDITSVIFHFDVEVLQQTYDQHQGFNFFYFFVSSVVLLLVSHIFNAAYWTLIKHSKKSQVDMGKQIKKNFT